MVTSQKILISMEKTSTLCKKDIHDLRGYILRTKRYLDKSFPKAACFDMLYQRPYFGQAGTWNRNIYRDSQLTVYLLVKRMRKYNAMLPENQRIIYYYGYDEFFEKFEKEIPNMDGFPELNESY